MLMKRFPRLQLLNQKSTKKKIKVILAACGLHNICIMENDNVKFYIRKASQVLKHFTSKEHKELSKYSVNELMRTLNHIQFEGKGKRLFLIQVKFSVNSLYFMDKLLLLIPAVSINSYYLLVSVIIALTTGVCSFCFGSMFILCSSLRYKSLSIYRLET